ncbi:homogentisate phytyltransferase 1, chloroplastic-like [Olea europaea var. sylvestris]|uniref:homogentisate phytyltransferase 1, chloroplastic-like n=1 Tax=Olea europaea var. sylvestris TaxID=158386 RepID=UPI000C1D1D8C|nr:homogentisate phytyltransferase 1, chloroplastic-like [Olea europaea var. sylvestris]
MESLLVCSFQKPPSSLQFPATAEPYSLFTGSRVEAQYCKCKALNNPENSYAIPMRLQLHRQLAMQQFVRNNSERIVALSPRCRSKYLVSATSEHNLESEPSKSRGRSIQHALDAFYRFSRPHTVIGTALSIISVSLLAVENLSDISPLFVTGVIEAIAAALLMNIYIVGLNQLSDIEIDKVNKPYLPLASGEYSVTTGVMIISSFAMLSFSLGWIVGSWPLFWALFISFVLGTAYSINLPLLRWKRFAFVAAMCILAVRAVIVQIAFFLHIQMHVYGRPAVLSKSVIFATAFMSFFSVVIALFKDIPDIVGDKIYGIRSFTVRLGQQRVFWICISLLEMAYLVALLVGVTSTSIWSKWITVIGHIALASLLWNRANSVDLKSKTAITSFYMFIWKLFYAEYLLIPLVR